MMNNGKVTAIAKVVMVISLTTLGILLLWYFELHLLSCIVGYVIGSMGSTVWFIK